MIKKPLYVFDTPSSTGLDNVPVNGTVLVESTGDLFILKSKTSPVTISSATQISAILAEPTQFISMGATYPEVTSTTGGVLTDAQASKFDGIEANAEVNSIDSDPTGITGADQVTNIVSLTQIEYDALTPDASTFYVIVD